MATEQQLSTLLGAPGVGAGYKYHLRIAMGQDLPDSWGYHDLAQINLGSIPPGLSLDSAGLHKRVRAGLGSLLRRSGEQVSTEWEHSRIHHPGGQADYDRLFVAGFTTTGSLFGSDRAAIVRAIWAKHVTVSGTITSEPLYVDGIGMYGICTDFHGDDPVVFRFFLPIKGIATQTNEEVVQLYHSLVQRAQSSMLEDLLHDEDVRRVQR